MGSGFCHSTAKVMRLALISAGAGVAMAMSAVAGAWVQSHLDSRYFASAEQMSSSEPGYGNEYLRQQLGVMAEKLGDMQARLIALEGLSERVADAAGVAHTTPEAYALLIEAIQENQPLMGSEYGVSTTPMALGTHLPDRYLSAEALGRELDGFATRLGATGDRMRLLDTVLTQRTGLMESLPSMQPVDQPYTSSSFGWRRHPITGRHSMHEGLDFPAPRGTPILAASGGVVTEARYVPGYGKMVEINHGNGLVTRYAHASSINVQPGDLVTKGQQIARVGSTGRSTGAHLHFEVRVAGHPLDPTLFLADATSAADLIASSGASEGGANDVQLR